MKNRIETLNRIDKLLRMECEQCPFNNSSDSKDNHCSNGCSIGKELEELGNDLKGNRDERLQKIIDKGEDMTTKDLMYLRKNGLTIIQLAKATGINKEYISQIVSDLEGGNKDLLTQYEQAILKNKNFNRYIKLKEIKMSNKEISKKLKVSIKTVYKYNTFNKKRLDLGIALDDIYNQVSSKSTSELVKEMYGQGFSEKQIAEKLKISRRTASIYKNDSYKSR